MKPHIKLTFDDVPTFLKVLEFLQKKGQALGIEYEMHGRMVECPQKGPGGRFQTPGAIFLSYEGLTMLELHSQLDCSHKREVLP